MTVEAEEAAGRRVTYALDGDGATAGDLVRRLVGGSVGHTERTLAYTRSFGWRLDGPVAVLHRCEAAVRMLAQRGATDAADDG